MLKLPYIYPFNVPLYPAAHTTPTSDFYATSPNHALTTTGPELYTNCANDSGTCTTFPNPRANHYWLRTLHDQASATASTSLCVVL